MPSNKTGYHRWQRVVSALSCVVVFITTYALILPAITMTKPNAPVCGYAEHTHNGDCYGMELICELPESENPVHEHTAECFQSEWELGCELSEGSGHTHTDACYTYVPACTLPESEGHTHTDACYTQLTCELPEGEEHTHTEACTGRVLTCTFTEGEGHTHTEQCAAHRELTCDKEEAQAHIHNDDCWVEVPTVICGMEETAVEPHTHTEECYQLALICELPEHTHSDACRAENVADAIRIYAQNQFVRSAEADFYIQWYLTQPNADQENRDPGYAFASYVLHAFGAQGEVKLAPDANRWLEGLRGAAPDMLKSTEDYTPVAGDLVFLYHQATNDYTVGVITAVTSGGMKLLTAVGEGYRNLGEQMLTFADSSIVSYLPIPDDSVVLTETPEVEPEQEEEEKAEEPEEEIVAEPEGEQQEEHPTIEEFVPNPDGESVKPKWNVDDFEDGIGGYAYYVEKTMSSGMIKPRIMLMSGGRTAPAGLLLNSADVLAAVYYRPAGDTGDWRPVTAGASIDANASFRIVADYANVDPELLAQNNYRLLYKIEDYLTNISASGKIDINGEKRGEVSAEEGYVVLTFDHAWVDSLYGGTDNKKSVAGSFSYAGGLDLAKLEDAEGNAIHLGDIDIAVPDVSDSRAQYAEVTVTKGAANKLIHDEANDKYYLEYTITVEAGQFGATDVKLIDILSGAKNPNGTLKYVDKSTYPAGYVGVTSTQQNPTGSDVSVFPVETVTNGKADAPASVVYLTAVSGDAMKAESMRGQKPPVSGSGPNMAWYIGEMEPNETRTLTYRVAVSRDYIGILHNNDDTISNTAQLFSKNYSRGIERQVFAPTATARLVKESSNIRKGEDGLFYVDYEIRVTADSNNSYVLEDLKVYDHTNDNSPYRQHVKILPETVKIFSGDGTQEIDLDTYKSYTAPNGQTQNRDNPKYVDDTDMDKRNFNIFIGDLEPSESRIIRYTMTIDEKKAEPLANGNIDIYNQADLHSSEIRQNQKIAQDVTRNTVGSLTWDRKLGGGQIRNAVTVDITNKDHVYDLTGGSLTKVTSNVPNSYTIPASSFRYTIVVNETGDWDVSGANMVDNLGTNNINGSEKNLVDFVGYIELKVYDQVATSNNGDENVVQSMLESQTAKASYWIKIDDLTSFSFKPSDLGLSDSDAYVMTYYANFTNESNWGKQIIGNSFGISGSVGNGSEYFQVSAYSRVSKEVVEPGVKDPVKYGWYYDANDKGFGDKDLGNGNFYWVTELVGDKIVAGARFEESVRITNDNNWANGNSGLPANILRNEGSHIGFYTAILPEGESIQSNYANLEEFQKAVEAGVFNEVPSSYYTINYTTNTGGTWAKDENGNPYYDISIRFTETYGLTSGEKLYWVVRTEPTVRPATNSNRTYWNKVNFTTDSSHWVHPAASLTIADNSNGLRKTVGGIYEISHNGNTAVVKDKQTGNAITQTDSYSGDATRYGPFRLTVRKGDYAKQNPNYDLRTNSTTDKTTGDGTYITWLVSANTMGVLDGDFTLVDTLPDGVDLCYVRAYSAGGVNYGYGNSGTSNYYVEAYKGSGTNTLASSYNDNGPQYIFAFENAEYEADGWTKNVVHAHPSDLKVDRNFTTVTYYTKGNQIKWDTKLIRGKSPIVYQVVCKVDPTKASKFEDNFYNNQAMLLDDRGLLVDDRGAEAMIAGQSANKSALIEGLVDGGTVGSSLFPYEIVVNEEREDMVENSAVITVPLVDRMSHNLNLSNETLMIFKDKAYNTDANGMPELIAGGYATQKTDSGIKYIWDNLLYYGGTYVVKTSVSESDPPWYTTDATKAGVAVGNVKGRASINVATIENSVDEDGNPVLHDGKPMRSIEFSNLPDSTRLVVRYSVSATFDAAGSSFANKAFWKGFESNINGETESNKVFYQVESSAMVQTHGALLITKYDAANENHRLSNAEFRLYRAQYRDHSSGYLLWEDDVPTSVKAKRYLGVYFGAYEVGDVHHDTEIRVKRNKDGNITEVEVPADKNNWNSVRTWKTLTDAVRDGYEFHHELEYDANGNIQVYYGEELGRGLTDKNGMLSYGLAANLGTMLDKNGNVITGTSEEAKELEDRIHYNKIYAVVETKAPTGYQVDSTPRFFVIPKPTNLLLNHGDLQTGSYFYHSQWPDSVHVVTQTREDQPTYLMYMSNPRQPLEITKTFTGSATGMRPGTYTFGVWSEENGLNPTKGNILAQASLTYDASDFGYYRLGELDGVPYVSVFEKREDGWHVINTSEDGTSWEVSGGDTLPTDVFYGVLPGREKKAVFSNLPYGTYYVYELNGAGYPADAGQCTIGGLRYEVTMSGAALMGTTYGKVEYASGKNELTVNNAYFDLTVSKRFFDPDNNSDNAITGTYRFGIWAASDVDEDGLPFPGRNMAADPVELTWSADETEVKEKIGHFTNLKPATSYYIYELDSDGQPIFNGALTTVGGKQFDVSYENGNVVSTHSATHGDHPANVAVTNTVRYFSLPMTGGMGERMYTMGGALLMGVSLLLGSAVRRKRERRKDF